MTVHDERIDAFVRSIVKHGLAIDNLVVVVGKDLPKPSHILLIPNPVFFELKPLRQVHEHIVAFRTPLFFWLF